MRPAQTKLESSAAESLDEEDEANCSAGPDGWLWGAAMKLLGVATRSKVPLNKEN